MVAQGEDEECALVTEKESPSHQCWEALKMEWKLVLYKIQYFFVMGACAIDLVFFKLLLKQSGMSATQIGIISGIAPYVTFLANIIVSTLANKYRKGKVVLLVSCIAAVAFGLAIAFVPLPMIISNCTLLELPTNTSSMDTGLLTDLSWLYEEADLVFTFYVLLVCHLAFWTFRALAMAFTDVALVSHLGESRMSKYAYQKAFGALGGAVLEVGTGAILTITVYEKMVCDLELTFSDYQIAYYIEGIAMMICFLVACTFRFENDKGERRDSSTKERLRLTPQKTDNKKSNEFSLKKLVGILSSVHYVSWILCVFYSSFCMSVSSYSSLYLNELGADSFLIGVVGAVASGSNIMFFFFGSWIVEKFGTINCLSFSLLAEVMRFGILAIITDPRLGLLVSVLCGITMSLSWVAIIRHASDSFPKAYITTGIGIVHGTYTGVGTGTGQLVGGVVIDAIGPKYTFATFAGVTLIFTAIFALVQKLSKRPSFDDSEEETIRSDFEPADKAYGTETET